LRQLSPRLGYYIVSFGTVLEFLGLVGDSWSAGGSSRILSFHQPGDVLLVIGLALTVLGTILGLISLSEELTNDPKRAPRLLPAMPLVLLVGIAVGSVAFAYQASAPSTGTAASTAGAASNGQSPSGSAVQAAETPQCPPDTFWLAATQQCLSVTADANGNRAVATPVPAGSTPVCPANTYWHDVMKHCMPNTCPAGFVYNYDRVVCDPLPGSAQPTSIPGGPSPTPVCPVGTFWHPVMNHCMSTVCPIGYQWDATSLICVQSGGPTPVPTATPALPPGETPSPTPSISPTPTAVPTPLCPAGYFWHPVMGHCMSNTCPPGLVFNYTTLYCELPSTGTPPATVTPAPTATPTPTLTPAPSPTATIASPTPVPTPLCPAGYFWHPVMGHCMSNVCPPGLVFNYNTLYCELPPTPGL
jgi:hypothetical protein